MKRIIILIVSLLLAGGAQAQLTLDACRKMARDHYPEIRQYDLIRLSERYTLQNAQRAWLPQITLSAQATWQSAVPDFPVPLRMMIGQMGYQMVGMAQDQYKVAVEVNQTIWDGGKYAADKKIAQAEAAEQQRAADVNLYALDGRIDDLYFGILLLDERIAQTREVLGLLQSNLDKVRACLKNGVATQSDADAIEAELLTMRQQLTQIEASRSSYRQMLALFVGEQIDDQKLLRPELVEPSGSEPARPELELFDATLGKLTAQEAMVRASTQPRIGLFVQGYYGYPGLNMFNDMASHNWSLNAILGVRMQWNIGGYYTKSNSLKKLRVAQQKVEVNRDIFLFNNKLQVAHESGEITRLRRALADDDRIVALRRSVRLAAESKLRNGVIDTTDLLTKITDENAALVARSAREIELLKSIYELKYTINR